MNIHHARQRAIDYAELLAARGWRLLEGDVQALIEEARGQLEIVPASDTAAVARVQERVRTLRLLLDLPGQGMARAEQAVIDEVKR